MFAFAGKTLRFAGRATLAASRAVQVGVSAGVVLVAFKGYALLKKVQESKLPPELPENERYLLHLDLTKTTISTSRPDSVQRVALSLGEQRRVMYYNDLVAAVKNACVDDQVLGIVTTMGHDTGLGFATTKELRDAIQLASDNKKFTAVHVKSFGNVLDSGMRTYYLASAFRFIGMRPTGEVNLGGLKISTPFFRGLLEKLGVEAEFDQRGRYKGYVDQYASDKFSDGSRRSLSNVLAGIEEEMVNDIVKSRGFSEKDFQSLMQQGFFLSREAIQKRLINFVSHEDDMIASALKKVGDAYMKKMGYDGQYKAIQKNPQTDPSLSLEGADSSASSTTTTVAVSPSQKPDNALADDASKDSETSKVVRIRTLDVDTYIKARSIGSKALRKPTTIGNDVSNPANAAIGDSSDAEAKQALADPDEKCVGVIELGANFDVKEVQKQFKFARDSPAIGAIVFRVNSPGGEVQKFETIAYEVIKTRKAGKKVIVSMGDVAASGGYLVAAPADKIFAMPTTITGSIGVAAGKFAFDGLMQKLGVTADSIRSQDLLNDEHFNPSPAEIAAEAWSDPGGADRSSTIFTRMTDKQKSNFSRSLDASYSWFKAQVGVGRKMTPEQVEAVAQGRVWTGSQAVKNGLVDQLGSLDSTIFFAKTEILENDTAKVVYIEPSFAVQLSRFLSNSYSVAQLTSTLVALAAESDPSKQVHSTRVDAKLPGAEYVK
eukprot:TRINITY_DN5737_c0_g1_i1.p1 TRINITY_DN5737_c0_g1~~TRINITY_DN5737_c0_g1_i1.p1  ORF type:complete len:716 (-),score=163.23 TRINITY_DN5737_c0_g1_i1:6-2153(-)